MTVVPADESTCSGSTSTTLDGAVEQTVRDGVGCLLSMSDETASMGRGAVYSYRHMTVRDGVVLAAAGIADTHETC